MGSGVFNAGFLVGSDAFVLMMPFCHELTNGSLSDPREVSDDEPGVFSSKFDLSREAEVVANKAASAGDNTCWKCLVVAVSESKHPTVVIIVRRSKDFHQSEVAMTFMTETVGLGADAKIGALEGLLYGLNQSVVRYGAPAGC